MNVNECQKVATYDECGIFAHPQEKVADFLLRAEKENAYRSEFHNNLLKNKKAYVFDSVYVNENDLISSTTLEEGKKQLRELYGSAPQCVSGFYISQQVGLLWGGAAISDDKGLSLMFLRNAFRTKNKWLFYSRKELVAHELCHVMRQALNEESLEEFFAYRTSNSWLRRCLGNCFIYECDAWGFLLSALLLPISEILGLFNIVSIPLKMVACVAVIFPCYLLLRNIVSYRIVSKALRALKKCGIKQPLAVAFRCTREELKTIGTFQNSGNFCRYVKMQIEQDEARWIAIYMRFCNSSPVTSNNEVKKKVALQCRAQVV